MLPFTANFRGVRKPSDIGIRPALCEGVRVYGVVGVESAIAPNPQIFYLKP